MAGERGVQNVFIPDTDEVDYGVLQLLHYAVAIDVDFAERDGEDADVFVDDGGGDQGIYPDRRLRRGFSEVVYQGLDAFGEGLMVWVRGDTKLVEGQDLCAYKHKLGRTSYSAYCVNVEVKDVRLKDFGNDIGVPVRCYVVLKFSDIYILS